MREMSLMLSSISYDHPVKSHNRHRSNIFVLIWPLHGRMRDTCSHNNSQLSASYCLILCLPCFPIPSRSLLNSEDSWYSGKDSDKLSILASMCVSVSLVSNHPLQIVILMLSFHPIAFRKGLMLVNWCIQAMTGTGCPIKPWMHLPYNLSRLLRIDLLYLGYLQRRFSNSSH